jgi:hypothetical protein
MSTFSPLLIPALILEPLKYFFKAYGPVTHSGQFVWDEDEKKRTVDLGYTENFFRVPLEERPRVIVDRGSFQIAKTGLTDNMAEQKTLKETEGLKKRINMVFYNGVANVIVEARHKGSCELVADMVSHFIVWARPEICDTQGFKEFGLPMSISPCGQTTKENDVKFQIQMQIPYMQEEHWRVRDHGVMLKALLYNIDPNQL